MNAHLKRTTTADEWAEDADEGSASLGAVPVSISESVRQLPASKQGRQQGIRRLLVPLFVVALISSTLGVAAFVPSIVGAQTGTVNGDSSFTLYESVGPDQISDASAFAAHFPGTDANGLEWFPEEPATAGAVPPVTCTVSAADGVRIILPDTNNAVLPCGSVTDTSSNGGNNRADRVVMEGFIFVPDGATGVEMRMANSDGQTPETLGRGALYAYASPADDLDDLAFLGGDGFNDNRLNEHIFDLPLPGGGSPCAAPAATGFRVYVYDRHAAMFGSITWRVTDGAQDTGGVFTEIPADHVSSVAGYDNDPNDNGTPDYQEQDADGDSIGDWEEMGFGADGATLDTDDDGTPDCEDTDSDNDGSLDGVDPNRTVATATADTATVGQGSTLSFDAAANDVEFASANNSVTDLGTGNATGATISSEGVITWNTTGVAFGSYTFNYEICNDAVDPAVCAPGSVSLTVEEAAVSGPAPGGVTEDLAVWLVGDRGTDGTANGDLVTEWTDQSTFARAFSATTAQAPSIADNAVNFNRGVSFNANKHLSLAGGVLDPNDDHQLYMAIEYRTPSNVAWSQAVGSQGKLLTASGGYVNNTTGGVNTDGGPAGTEPRVNTVGQIGRDVTTFFNGAQVDTSTHNVVGTVTTSNVGGQVWNGHDTNGEILEFIALTDDSTVQERQQIESYLAIKYGITLDAGLGSYADSTGADIFTSAAHWNDVAGIGADSASTLDQRVSKSENDDGIITIATTGDFASANLDTDRTSLTDGSFAVWGNDDGAATFDAGSDLLDRTWTIEETGTVGTVQLQVDVDDANFDIEAFTGTLQIVAGSDLSTATPIAMTDAGNGLWNVAHDFTDGDLFSFALDNRDPAPDLQAGDDTGLSSTDDLTSKADARFNVDCPANGTVITLYSDNPVAGTVIGAHTCTSNLTQAVTAGTGGAVLAEGVHNLTTTETAGGVEGPPSAALQVTVDLTGPSAPTADPVLQPGSDDGASNSDHVTSITRPTFDVECSAAGSLVWLYSDQYTDPVGSIGEGAETGSAINSGGNTLLAFADTFTAPFSGEYIFVRRAESISLAGGGAGGNGNLAIGTTELGTDVYVDTTPANRLLPGELEKQNTVSLIGGVEYFVHAWAGGGARVNNPSYSFLPTTAAIGFHTCDGAGTEGASVNLLDLDLGVHEITYTQTDEAGNESAPSAPLDVAIGPEAAEPATPDSAPDLQAGSDNGPADDDNETSTATQTFDIPCGEVDSTVTLYSDNPAASAPNAVGTATCELDQSVPEVAESTSAALVATSPAGSGDDVLIPLAPGQVRLRVFNAPVSAQGDLVTANRWPYREELPSTYTNFDDVVESYHDSLVDPSTVATGPYYGNEWTFILEPGVYSFAGGWDDGYSLAFSPTGNQQDMTLINSEGWPASTTFEPTADFRVETPTVFQLRTTDFNGFVGAIDSILYEQTPNTTSVTIDPGLVDGVHNVTFTETNDIGESGHSPALEVTIAGATPAPTSAPNLQDASDNGSSNTDDITSSPTQTFDVQCTEAGNTITIYTDVPAANTVVGTHLCGEAGTVGATVTGLPVGIHNITNTETNDAGESGPSPALEVTIDDDLAIDITIDKTSTGDYVGGEDITYTIVVGNDGPGYASVVRVSDTFPAGVSGVTWTCAASSTASSCANASGSGNIAQSVSIASGDTVTFTATGTVGATINSLTNEAVASPLDRTLIGSFNNIGDTATSPFTRAISNEQKFDAQVILPDDWENNDLELDYVRIIFDNRSTSDGLLGLNVGGQVSGPLPVVPGIQELTFVYPAGSVVSPGPSPNPFVAAGVFLAPTFPTSLDGTGQDNTIRGNGYFQTAQPDLPNEVEGIGDSEFQVEAQFRAAPAPVSASVTDFRILDAPTDAPDLQAASDTGDADDDDITSDSTPAFDVVCSAAGHVITLYSDIDAGTTSTVSDDNVGDGALVGTSQQASFNAAGGFTIPGLADMIAAVPNGATWRVTTIELALNSAGQNNWRLVNSSQGVTSGIVDQAGNPDQGFPNFVFSGSFQPAPSDQFTLSGVNTGSKQVQLFDNDGSFAEASALTGNPQVRVMMEITNGATAVGAHTCAGVGTESATVDAPGLDDGVHNITFTESVGTGPESAPSPSLEVTIDATAPAAPGSAPDLVDGSDSGAANDDDVTSEITPTFGVECLEAGSTITLFSDNPAANTAVGTHTCADVGTEAATVGNVPGEPVTTQPQLLGAPSTPSDWTWSNSAIWLPSNGVVLGAGGNFTAIESVFQNFPSESGVDYFAEAVFTSSHPASFALVEVIDVNTGAVLASTTTTPNVGNPETATLSFTGTGGPIQFRITNQGPGFGSVEFAEVATAATTLTDGVHNITYTETDLVGNESAPSPALALTIDTEGPATAPTVDEPEDGATIGTATPTVSGTGGEPGGTVVVTGPNGETCTAPVAADGSWSCEIDPALVEGGPSTITVTPFDPAGNEGPATTFETTVDTTAPAAPASAPDLTDASDTGISDSDDITADDTPTFTVECSEAGSTITLYSDTPAPGTAVGTHTCAGVGAESVSVATPGLDDGVHNITFTETDLQGNESASSDPVELEIDTEAPGVPEITSPASGSTVGTSTPTVSGTGGVPGGTVVVTGPNGETCVAPVAADGSWSCTLVPGLPEGGPSIITATPVDPSGNQGTAISIATTIDTTSPTPGQGPDLQAASDTGESDSDDITADTTPTFDVVCSEAGATITLYSDNPLAGTIVGTHTCEGAGIESVTVDDPGLVDGEHNLTFTETDALGNESAPSDPLALTIDSEGPVTPTVSEAGGGETVNTVNTATPTLTGTGGEPGTTVVVTGPNGETCSAEVQSDGSWSCTLAPGLPEGGPSEITITPVDPAGNAGEPASFEVTVDTNPDSDGDGVTDSEENERRGGDGNGDGIADATQPSVASVSNLDGDGFHTLASTGITCTTVTEFGVLVESTASPDPSFTYPSGLFDFTLECDNAGEDATVTISFDGDYDTAAWEWRKFDRNTNTYTSVDGVTFGTAVVDGEPVTTATFDLVDGGFLDEDGALNASITDPSGPGIAIASEAPPALAFTGRTFLATVAFAQILVLLGAIMWFIARRRRNGDLELG